MIFISKNDLNAVLILYTTPCIKSMFIPWARHQPSRRQKVSLKNNFTEYSLYTVILKTVNLFGSHQEYDTLYLFIIGFSYITC